MYLQETLRCQCCHVAKKDWLIPFGQNKRHEFQMVSCKSCEQADKKGRKLIIQISCFSYGSLACALHALLLIY